MNHTYADLVRVSKEVLMEAWGSGAMAILSWRRPISMAALIYAILDSRPAHVYREYTESDLNLAYPLFAHRVPIAQPAYIEIFREAYALRRKRVSRSLPTLQYGRYLSQNTMRRLRLAHDAWAYAVWIRRGAPTFGRRIISGVKMGEPLTRTNGMTGRRRKILWRLVGVEKVVDATTGHVKIKMGIRP